MQIQQGDFRAAAVGMYAIKAISTLYQKRIQENEKTKRMLIACSSALFAIASVLPIFAPEGRQSMSFMVSAGLVVFALGAAGITTFRLKTAEIKLEAEMQSVKQFFQDAAVDKPMQNGPLMA